jgi:hypothetical protein
MRMQLDVGVIAANRSRSVSWQEAKSVDRMRWRSWTKKGMKQRAHLKNSAN